MPTKRGLILIGKTNSGKLTFADLLCYYYPHHSIGYFTAPEVIGSNNLEVTGIFIEVTKL